MHDLCGAGKDQDAEKGLREVDLYKVGSLCWSCMWQPPNAALSFVVLNLLLELAGLQQAPGLLLSMLLSTPYRLAERLASSWWRGPSTLRTKIRSR